MAWPLDLFDPTPTPEQVREQLQRILDSPEFARTTRQRDLLRFVVTQVLDGREDRLTTTGIAAEVFGRTSSFDPESDSIVRTEAARLRNRLDRYYGSSGSGEPVRIVLNRGDYLPVFLFRYTGPWWRRLLAALRRLMGFTTARNTKDTTIS
jgi:hypothetical protein